MFSKKLKKKLKDKLTNTYKKKKKYVTGRSSRGTEVKDSPKGLTITGGIGAKAIHLGWNQKATPVIPTAVRLWLKENKKLIAKELKPSSKKKRGNRR